MACKCRNCFLLLCVFVSVFSCGTTTENVNQVSKSFQLGCNYEHAPYLVCYGLEDQETLVKSLESIRITYPEGILDLNLKLVNCRFNALPIGLFNGFSTNLIELENTILPFLSPPFEKEFSLDSIGNEFDNEFAISANNLIGLHFWDWKQLNGRIQYLIVEKCRFVALPDNFCLIMRTTSASELTITESHLKWIGPGALGCPKISMVKLSNNEIESLNKMMFFVNDHTSSNIRNLYLEGNRITSLPADVFEYVNIEKSLYLSNNPIKILNKDTFRKFYDLTFQLLRPRYLQCDCSLSWLVKFQRSGVLNVECITEPNKTSLLINFLNKNCPE